MDKLQRLKERQNGIGGSDVGAIMGMNKWKSSFQVYAEKIEEIKEVPDSSEAAYFGSGLKEVISKEFMQRTGKKIRRYAKQLVHKEYPFMIANIDRRVLGENSILMCKTAGTFTAKEWEGEEVPARHILQCQHNLAVSGADKCYLAVLIGGQKLLIKEILLDEELVEMIIAAEKEFWAMHVIPKIPPSLDGSEVADKYLKDKYPNSDSSMQIDLNAKDRYSIAKYLSLKEKIKTMEDEAKTLENNIKNKLGEAEKGVIGNFIVSWKPVHLSRIDIKALKDKYPEVYRAISRETASRRFEVKTRGMM